MDGDKLGDVERGFGAFFLAHLGSSLEKIEDPSIQPETTPNQPNSPQ
jgi:hypothetical protein